MHNRKILCDPLNVEELNSQSFQTLQEAIAYKLYLLKFYLTDATEEFDTESTDNLIQKHQGFVLKNYPGVRYSGDKPHQVLEEIWNSVYMLDPDCPFFITLIKRDSQ